MPTHRSLPDPSVPDPLADQLAVLDAAARPFLPADAPADELDEPAPRVVVDPPSRALTVSYWLLAAAFVSTFLTAAVWSSWEGVLAQGLATVLLWGAYWIASLVASS